MVRPRPMPSGRIEFLLSTRERHDPLAEYERGRGDAGADDGWDRSDVWAYASGRVGDYAPEQWVEVSAGQHAWEHRLVELLQSGASPSGAAAVALAEEQREWIERWYFTCPRELHREVIDALLDDASFRLRYDGLASGAADFIRCAVAANARG